MTENRILFIIVFAQFCCTSLWFASNGVIDQLIPAFELPSDALGYLTSAVQFGFIVGTLIVALTNIADRYSPSTIFFIAAILGAFFNAMMLLELNTFWSLFIWRFAVGSSLAGIYPIGMKIASDYFDSGLGKSLGLLVGALVLGTALPHLMNGFAIALQWSTVLILISVLSLLGGLVLWCYVPDGPYRKSSASIQLHMAFEIFKKGAFRRAALGYFGHMWELYTFWTFVPLLLAAYLQQGTTSGVYSPLYTFAIIGSGALACVLAAYSNRHFSSQHIARFALGSSLICCLISPLVYYYFSFEYFFSFLLLWGMLVIIDSPMLSTLVAQNAPSAFKGTALTIVTCIGFALTIVSIQLTAWMIPYFGIEIALFALFIGPFLGFRALSTSRD